MDYYEGIVEKYIAADRETFVSPQFYLKSSLQDFWIDVVAVHIRTQTIFLCEVTFSRTIGKILAKTTMYIEKSDLIRNEICTASGIPSNWEVRPWLFLLKASATSFVSRWSNPIKPKITYLESTAPWFTPNGFRSGEPAKPYSDLPAEFQ